MNSLSPPLTIAFHSYKGGTGKTSHCLNFGTCLAKDFGQKVCILDFDFYGPSLIHTFGLKEDKFDKIFGTGL